MLKQIFGSRPATRIDVILAAGAAVMAVVNFINVRHEYKSEQDNNEKEINS